MGEISSQLVDIAESKDHLSFILSCPKSEFDINETFERLLPRKSLRVFPFSCLLGFPVESVTILFTFSVKAICCSLKLPKPPIDSSEQKMPLK